MIVVLYDSNRYESNDILKLTYNSQLQGEGISALVQQVKRA